jgi:hypothetical protein
VTPVSTDSDRFATIAGRASWRVKGVLGDDGCLSTKAASSCRM